MDIRISEILDQIKYSCLSAFASNLVGIYVHGSLAMDCFQWNHSDIDFIVVVRTEPSLQQKEHFIRALLFLEPICPPKGLEMSVVLEKDVRHFTYPTPFSLHFSNMHKTACQTHLADYCRKMNGTDCDLAAHFTIIRHACIRLLGPAENELFDPVPRRDYLDSIKNDIISAPEEIIENPVYMILNLCRVLAFVKEDLILSKKEGGVWGINHLPDLYVPLVQAALLLYTNTGSMLQMPESPLFAASALLNYAEYMKKEIFFATESLT